MQRTVHNTEALSWLEKSPMLEGCSFVTSLPDLSEFPAWSVDEWKAWFLRAVSLVLARCPSDGVAIFFQTDRKQDGEWIDKGYLVQKAAEASGATLLWHKVVCKVPSGEVAYGAPGFSHLLCFSKTVRVEISKSTADVLPQAGEVTWTRGMGVEACLMACRFILSHTVTRTVVDPFCGHGTVLAVANHLGLDAVGIELGSRRARRARSLRYECSGLCWSLITC